MKNIEHHQKAIRLLHDINDFEQHVASLEEKITMDPRPDPSKRNELKQWQRSLNALIVQYNRTIRLAKPIPVLDVDLPFIERFYRSLTPRTANGLRFYFRHISEAVPPTMIDVMNIDLDAFGRIRNMGTLSTKELGLAIQSLKFYE